MPLRPRCCCRCCCRRCCRRRRCYRRCRSVAAPLPLRCHSAAAPLPLRCHRRPLRVLGVVPLLVAVAGPLLLLLVAAAAAVAAERKGRPLQALIAPAAARIVRCLLPLSKAVSDRATCVRGQVATHGPPLPVAPRRSARDGPGAHESKHGAVSARAACSRAAWAPALSGFRTRHALTRKRTRAISHARRARLRTALGRSAPRGGQRCRRLRGARRGPGGAARDWRARVSCLRSAL